MQLFFLEPHPELCDHRSTPGAQTRQPQPQEEHRQEGSEGLEQIYEPEWRQLLEAEEHSCSQREEQEQKGTRGNCHFHSHSHPHSHPHSQNFNSHTFCGHDEIGQDNTDLEYITSILEAFANLETTLTQANHKKKHQNFDPMEPNKDATLRT